MGRKLGEGGAPPVDGTEEETDKRLPVPVLGASMSSKLDPALALAWARGVHERRAVLYQREAVYVGRVARVWSGEEGDQYVSPYNDRPMTVPVLEFEGGGSGVADPTKFLELSEEGATFFEEVGKAVQELLVGAMRLAAKSGVDGKDALMILHAVLRSQSQVLAAAEVGGEAMP